MSMAGRQLRTDCNPEPLVLTAAGIRCVLAVLAAHLSDRRLPGGQGGTARPARGDDPALATGHARGAGLSPAIIDLYAGQRLLPEDRAGGRRASSPRAADGRRAGPGLGSPPGGGPWSARSAIPSAAALAVFLRATVLSAAVNAVPPQVAATGLIFTLDAAVLFYLPRMVGFSHEQSRQAMWAVAIVVVVTSLIGVGQADPLTRSARAHAGRRAVREKAPGSAPWCATRTSWAP